MHAKRRIVELTRFLISVEFETRIGAVFGYLRYDHLSIHADVP